jgi:mannose/cellobiose epimerase-like protein (N-acyl-D-glucosamine 2-epimerase family)
VLRFYYPDCIDTRFGGYIAQLDERDGHVYDAASKHLVATARAVHNFSVGTLVDGPVWCRQSATHGLQFLSTVQYDPDAGGYDWVLEGRETVDATRYGYGHAFALLASASALKAGIPRARQELVRAARVLEEQFFEPDHGLYADRATREWDMASYRGQNANMHACEAHIAAYEATADRDHLDRAYGVADALCRRLATDDGLLWEHYDDDWDPDFEYNRDQPRHQFRPWGYQPGHHAEWAKLLCLLDRHRDEAWLLERAVELFDAAVDLGWDDDHGGFYYTVDETGEPVVADKYSWATTEAIGAAALLGARLSRAGDDGRTARYLEWYDRLWAHAEAHYVNPREGCWYERLTRDHVRDGANHGVEVEPGYHPVTNCYLASEALADARVADPSEADG